MNFTLAAAITGTVYLAAGMALGLGGAKIRQALKVFPRHRPAAILLAAAAIAWTALMLWQSPLGWFEPYRRWLPVLTGGIYLLTITLAGELLAPRALGGLLLLAATPVLEAIRWEPTPWRLVLTVQAYVWVIAGIILVFSPHRFRRACEWLYHVSGRIPWIAAIILATGLLMLILSVTIGRAAPV